ncbi:MAG: hypothetical protein FH749_04620 [Firmicutes bacterium]|nr:hypothetical protein [Bacillota bacterium]
MRNFSLLLAILLSIAFAGCAQDTYHIMPVDDSVLETTQNFNDMAITYDLNIPLDNPKQLSVWMDTYEDGKHVERLAFYEKITIPIPAMTPILISLVVYTFPSIAWIPLNRTSYGSFTFRRGRLMAKPCSTTEAS